MHASHDARNDGYGRSGVKIGISSLRQLEFCASGQANIDLGNGVKRAQIDGQADE
jgi:hypothetical protein